MPINFKWDGHTHSQFCPHGSQDSTEKMIEKAIKLGFTHYSITEHAPLPEGLLANQRLQKELALQPNEIEDYFRHVKELKSKYRSQIVILSGLEVDYLPDHLEYTQDLLSQWSHSIDDWILSIHLLEGKKGLECIDFSPEDFQKGLVQYYGSIDKVHYVYWRTFEKMLTIKFQGVIPQRIGHMGLINKFTKVHSMKNSNTEKIQFFESIFNTIQTRGLTIDVNVAGFTYPLSNNGYLTKPMQYWCNKLKIKMVYGSDAHSIKAVGQSYTKFEDISKGIVHEAPILTR